MEPRRRPVGVEHGCLKIAASAACRSGRTAALITIARAPASHRTVILSDGDLNVGPEGPTTYVTVFQNAKFAALDIDKGYAKTFTL